MIGIFQYRSLQVFSQGSLGRHSGMMVFFFDSTLMLDGRADDYLSKVGDPHRSGSDRSLKNELKLWTAERWH